MMLLIIYSTKATGFNSLDISIQKNNPLNLRSFDNDIELININLPDYCVKNDEFLIEGNLKNIGNNSIISFEGEFLVNGVVNNTFYVSDIELEALETYSFTVGNQIEFNSPEIYIVELKITLVNGVEDETTHNNMLQHEISVASESVNRKPLFEMFTSSTCCPCNEGNKTLDAVLTNNSVDSFSLVKYPLNWPGDGDIYYNDDCGIRDTYYEIIGVPTLIINGKDIVTPDIFSQTDFQQALIEPAYIELTLYCSFDGISVNASLTIDPKINIEDASVHFAVVEKTTYNNIGTNGEKEFHNVLMTMLPDGSGISTSLVNGKTVSFERNTNLTSTFIEEFDDLKIVAWVQDNKTFSILQSESMDMEIQTNFKNTNVIPLRIFPIPSKGLVHVNCPDNVNIEIVDLNGNVLYNNCSTLEGQILDLSHIQRGAYFIRILRENGDNVVKKIIIN